MLFSSNQIFVVLVVFLTFAAIVRFFVLLKLFNLKNFYFTKLLKL